MNKEELINLLESTGVVFNEAILSDDNKDNHPRIAFWEFLWDENTASNENYDTTVTYQISFISRQPRDPGLLKLRKELNKRGYNPRIEHEFVEKEREFHSFLAIDIQENLDEISKDE